MNGEVIVVVDVAAAFADLVHSAFASRPGEEFSLVLTGGHTARSCYEALAAGAEEVNWWAVNVFWAEELCVPADDAGSRQRLGRQALLEKVGAANAVHPMRCEDGPEPYQLRLGELGRLDLVHLNLGPDGSVAGLFPGSPALDADPGQLVTRNVSAGNDGEYPRDWMTLTVSGIARARLVVITVGTDAGEALKAIIGGADLPGAQVKADRVVWLVETPAAG